MAKSRITQKVYSADIADHIDRAREFLAAAQECFESKLYSPAVSSAVHAGIHASDVMTGHFLGVRSSSDNHNDAIALLVSAGPNGKRASTQLKRLLNGKPNAQYDPAPISASNARAALSQAERLVRDAGAAISEQSK